MGNVARFAALSTKLDAISGRFLQEEDYEALLHKEKVTEVARYLTKQACEKLTKKLGRRITVVLNEQISREAYSLIAVSD